MATPICAGVVALMLEANPYLSPNDVKSILMSTAQPMDGDQAGYLDAQKAVEMAQAYLNFQKPKVSGEVQG
jgi:serine protease AprX